ncbi:hypothetical protein [Nocardia seriolae]|uniref:Uncharacterized protein n=1 Tax=Nocardia seriolae TaxID=37332 RepID=A0A0B8NBX6_9NOCA|nr:hypothetical protein [Nocardia seriolae]APA95631.1 hypothetical protein NS506_01560 [Nocardia seriolae]MTJ66239.1 hypothetical protein [Nocardia seriolae]MTJ74449.1 hypothetical protein [Nocardia seriolae]MTJ85848.1 hypothetical protein [Nocardia seriolae]MTK29844.1 hypothetical protein [Nocardia seriolae]
MHPACAVAGADLWWSPTPAGPWTLLRSGFNSGVTNSAAAETFTVYLAAGSVVCPGYYLSGNATITGPNTYFDGAFISY